MGTQKDIILFDGVCNLCCASIKRVIYNDPKKKFLFASLQSGFAKKHLHAYPNIIKDPDYLDSIVLIRNNKIYTKSSAALLIAKELSFPYPLLYVLIIIPRFIRDWLYSIIAKYRYSWFGKKETCMVPSPEISKRFIN